MSQCQFAAVIVAVRDRERVSMWRWVCDVCDEMSPDVYQLERSAKVCGVADHAYFGCVTVETSADGTVLRSVDGWVEDAFFLPIEARFVGFGSVCPRSPC